MDDSDEDPDYIPSEESDKSSDDNESGPENSNEDLLQNEDEYLVIENYVDGQVDEFFWRKNETIWMKEEPPTQRRTPHTNILRGPLPGLTVRSRNLGQTPNKS